MGLISIILRHDPAKVESALDKTLLDLGLPYLDLYLMHWPVAALPGGENVISFIPVCSSLPPPLHTVLPPASHFANPPYLCTQTWKAMSQLPLQGKVRHVGISNFSPSQLQTLLTDPSTTTKPFAHQMELHPYLPQTSWLLYHAQQGIHVTAYSPLGNANPTYKSSSPRKHGEVTPLLETDAVAAISKKRGCTPAQVVLSWGLARGVSVIPKSQHIERIEENFRAKDCALEFEDFVGLEDVGDVPVRFNNPSGNWGVGLYEGLQDS